MPWRGRYNTQAGKVALINACLSSLPMFLMGFYLLSMGTHAGFDKHRGAFYWNVADNKRKYRLVKWDLICKPKSLGGLGIINILVVNKCLIIKWWWKIMTTTSDKPLWLNILKAKYFPNSSSTLARASGASQFWKDLVKLRPTFQSLVKFVVHNGRSTRFWLDWWCGSTMLANAFPVLFSYYPDHEISIFSSNNWDLQHRRSLSPEELVDWQRLVAFFPVLSEGEDLVVWPHSPSGRFSVKSLYGKLISGTTTSKFKWIWRARIPPKIKIFLWQAFKGRLLAADQIRERNGPARSAVHYAIPWRTRTIFSLSVCWLSWFGAVLGRGFRGLGLLPPSLSFGSSPMAWLGSLSGYFGLVWGRFVGP